MKSMGAIDGNIFTLSLRNFIDMQGNIIFTPESIVSTLQNSIPATPILPGGASRPIVVFKSPDGTCKLQDRVGAPQAGVQASLCRPHVV
jgi:hypothetical protein